AQHESAIVLDFVPVETEEGMLGLEVADLQEAIDLGMKTGPAVGIGSINHLFAPHPKYLT
ncbi:hypothetical protein DM079_29580, partial [Klebsiella pneumoniae]